jgi:hypothetical protein
MNDRVVTTPPNDGRLVTREDGWLVLDPHDETHIPARAAEMIARHLPPLNAGADKVRSVLARMRARQNMYDRQRVLFGDFDDD